MRSTNQQMPNSKKRYFYSGFSTSSHRHT